MDRRYKYLRSQQQRKKKAKEGNENAGYSSCISKQKSSISSFLPLLPSLPLLPRLANLLAHPRTYHTHIRPGSFVIVGARLDNFCRKESTRMLQIHHLALKLVFHHVAQHNLLCHLLRKKAIKIINICMDMHERVRWRDGIKESEWAYAHTTAPARARKMRRPCPLVQYPQRWPCWPWVWRDLLLWLPQRCRRYHPQHLEFLPVFIGRLWDLKMMGTYFLQHRRIWPSLQNICIYFLHFFLYFHTSILLKRIAAYMHRQGQSLSRNIYMQWDKQMKWIIKPFLQNVVV